MTSEERARAVVDEAMGWDTCPANVQCDDCAERVDAVRRALEEAEERGAAWALSAALVAFAETEAWNDSRQAVYDLDPAEVCRRAREGA